MQEGKLRKLRKKLSLAGDCPPEQIARAFMIEDGLYGIRAIRNEALNPNALGSPPRLREYFLLKCANAVCMYKVKKG